MGVLRRSACMSARRGAPGRGRGGRRSRSAAHRSAAAKKGTHPPQRARDQAHRPRDAARARHFPRACRAVEAALSRSRRSSLANELAVAPGRGSGCAGWRSRCRRSHCAQERLWPGRRPHQGKARRAQDRTGREPHCHPRPRFRTFSRPRRLPRRRRPRRPALAGREDWREVPLVTIDPADAKDHDDAVHARPDQRSGKSRRLYRQCRHRRRRALRAGPVRRSTARRSRAATRCISRTASCRCCPSASRTICVRSGPERIGQRWRCAWWSARTDASAPTAFIAC